MLETERLSDLFSLLEEMTQSKTSYPESALSLKMQCLQRYFIRGFLLIASVFLVFALGLAAWQHYEKTAPQGFYNALLIVYLILQVLVLVYVTTLAAFAWRHRKQPFSHVLTALKNDLHRDAKFITRLWTFDKATLSYGLVQYRHRWSSSEDRVAGLTGDLRKLGLFPAWAAISVSAITLFKEDSNLLLWAPVIAAAIFYLVALYALGSRERPQQVIQLLEYAIQHADQCNTSPHDANPPVQE